MDENKIIELYLKERLTAQEIADKFLVKCCTIRNILTKHKVNRKSDPRRKAIDREILYQLYVIEKKSKPEIQKILGCCKQTLDKNLKFHGITSPYMNFTNEQLIDFYVNQLKSLTQINEITDIPKSRIRQILIKNGIQLRDKSACQCVNLSDKKLIDFDFSILKSQSTLKRRCQSFFKNHLSKVVKKERGGKCEICGSTENLHAHHIKPLSIILSQIIKENEGKSDDELYNIIISDPRYLDKDNLKVVCEKCHFTVYHPYVNYHVNQKPSHENVEGSETISNESTSQANGDGSALHLD